MPTVHYYADAALSKYCTEEREARAIADVQQLGEFPAPWPATLERLATYVMACTECMSSPGDIFQTKLNAYNDQFKRALAAATDARTAAATGAPVGTKRPAFAFVELERS